MTAAGVGAAAQSGFGERDFGARLAAYAQWKSELAATLARLQTWLAQQQLAHAALELPIYEAAAALANDRLTLAFVAEFSRGKSELINAIFFADQGRRVLPSDAGRTTMCPTELFWDTEERRPYLRLLPIETRGSELSISEYKREPIYWTTLPLPLDQPAALAERLRELNRTRTVGIEEAKRLGLYDPTLLEAGHMVRVPVWRHALISLPHPLLQQGLVILDTPGLNALGTEPELTLQMLPAAQALLFVLAADTGVTRSDLEVWQSHIQAGRTGDRRCIAVALNKIDTLWDELKDEAEVHAGIEAQRRSVAQQLKLGVEQVFPLSAQKGLLGKVRADAALVVRSRLPALERYLCEQVLPAKTEIVRQTLLGAVDGVVRQCTESVQGRLGRARTQLDELRGLRGKNADGVMELMRSTREQQQHYLKSVDSFQTSQRVLMVQLRQMQEGLDPQGLDRLIGATRQDMTEAWTTLRLKREMSLFFDGARAIMQEALTQVERSRRLVRATYGKFHAEHGLPELTPRAYSPERHVADLELLRQQGEAFRDSPSTVLTEQNLLIKKFFIQLVSRTRELFSTAHQEAQVWSREVMAPLIREIDAHKATIEERLDTLRKVNASRHELDQRIQNLEVEVTHATEQLGTLGRIRQELMRPLPQQEPITYPLPAAGMGAG